MIKKVLMSFLFAIFVFVSLCTNICNAASVKVTKENLKEAFQKFVSSELNEDNYSISVADDVINITADNESHSLNYDLTDKPTFSIEIPIEKGMSYEEFKKTGEDLSLLLLGYLAVANIQGVEMEDAVHYFSFSYLGAALNGYYSTENSYSIVDDLNLEEGVTIQKNDDPKTIYTSEFGDRVMEYVTATYPETQEVSDSDGINSYVMMMERKDTTETSCKLVYTLRVNVDSDFSQLQGYAEKIENSFTNNDTSKENLNSTNNNEDIANLNKIPQTGEEKNRFLIVLYTIVSVCSICLITLLFVSKRKK